MADVRDHFLGAEEGILEEKRVIELGIVAKVQTLPAMVPEAMVVKKFPSVVVAKVLKLPAMMVPEAMVAKKFPSVVVTDDLKLAVIMEVLTVVILVIREAPEVVVVKGARVVEDDKIVVEVGAMILVVKVVGAKKAEVLDMDPRVL